MFQENHSFNDKNNRSIGLSAMVAVNVFCPLGCYVYLNSILLKTCSIISSTVFCSGKTERLGEVGRSYGLSIPVKFSTSPILPFCISLLDLWLQLIRVGCQQKLQKLLFFKQVFGHLTFTFER